MTEEFYLLKGDITVKMIRCYAMLMEDEILELSHHYGDYSLEEGSLEDIVMLTMRRMRWSIYGYQMNTGYYRRAFDLLKEVNTMKEECIFPISTDSKYWEHFTVSAREILMMACLEREAPQLELYYKLQIRNMIYRMNPDFYDNTSNIDMDDHARYGCDISIYEIEEAKLLREKLGDE